MRYFAYGSCLNEESFKKTVGSDTYEILGVGRLDGYRLAFTRKNKSGGVLDIIESTADYVLGIVYEISDAGMREIDIREGVPTCYHRENVTIRMADVQIDVVTYMVVNKDFNEFKPSDEYFARVLIGMQRFPRAYINKYLIEHCNGKFDMNIPSYLPNVLYGEQWKEVYGHAATNFEICNPEFYTLLRQIYEHLSDDNSIVDAMQPTPEMFRLLAKCAEVAARNALDLSHVIPRSMVNRLAQEFERLSGVKTIRLPD